MLKTWQKHDPVLLKETLELLHFKNQGSYISKLSKTKSFIDATLGAGGHTIEICKLGGKVLGIDADSEMLEVARKRLKDACPGVFTAHGNFRNISRIARENGFEAVDGILFDLGISTLHLKDFKRGFSFDETDSALDMRLDAKYQNVTGADLLNVLRQDQLMRLFSEAMDFKLAKKLSEEVVKARVIRRFKTVGDFLEVIEKLPKGNFKINPATKPFMALRIAVNSELDSLKEGLAGALELLKVGGRVAVITFHSGEDRIVKEIFGDWEKQGRGREVNEKPIVPIKDEVEKNKKARSAKLRVFEKI